MRLFLLILISLLIPTLLFSGIPTEEDLTIFLDEINKLFALTINGGNFNSSFYLAGIPHFNIETGVSSLESSIKNPEGEETIKTSISMFHLKGSMGVFKGFTPTPSWKGFLGIETGVKGSISPLLGTLNQFKEKYPYSLSLITKLNLLKNYGFIPAISFSFEYSYLFDGQFKFFDKQTEETAFCSFKLTTLYYHLDIRENLRLVEIYTGIGWVSPTLKGNYEVNDATGDITFKPGTLSKLYFGLTVPAELIDVNLEFGKSQTYGFYGIALGFRM